MIDRLQRILYVDDDALPSALVALTLEELGGFSVTLCASGPEALTAFPQARPQMLLLDVMMPGMDGPETLRRLRLLPGGARVPVMLVTSRAEFEDPAAYRSLGALGVVIKPFDPARLCHQIAAIWDRLAPPPAELGPVPPPRGFGPPRPGSGRRAAKPARATSGPSGYPTAG